MKGQWLAVLLQRWTLGVGLSARGQMAIFIILIFQLLFFFFAMIVNVGIVVHHKINLQNAVDLGAYYAASKQAQVLNAISHYNYQIRQAYKLLAWRNRVLGAMTQQAQPTGYHPFLKHESWLPNQQYEEILFKDEAVYFNNEALFWSPYVCTQFSFWSHVTDDTDACATLVASIKDPPEFPEPKKPPAIFLPWNRLIYDRMKKNAEEFTKGCEQDGVSNYQLTAIWMKSYREAIKSRVKKIKALAQSLSENRFLDIEKKSVFEGTFKTIMHNLTRGNRGEWTEEDLIFFNSLEGTKTEHGVNWLRKMKIDPLPYYVDKKCNQGKIEKISVRNCAQLPAHAGEFISDSDKEALRKSCLEPSDEEDFRSTIGFEKNPWYMAYVGVEAQVKSIQPFMPAQGGIILTARAYAKPFGGRIGPWLRQTWPRGSDSSIGTEVDALLNVDPNPDSPKEVIPKAIPNYSRYPGDKLGLKSASALGSMGKDFLRSDLNLRIADWGNQDLNNPDQMDPLSRNTKVRRFEVAAMAPDVFDITYYSIDPHFDYNYRQEPKDFVRGVDSEGKKEEMLTIVNQIELSKELRKEDKFKVSFIVEDPAHLLTGWAPNQESLHFNYDFPEGEFGVCSHLTNPSPPRGLTRHGCPGKGGRAGYSVKLISLEYLRTLQPLGNDGSFGPIQNPPP